MGRKPANVKRTTMRVPETFKVQVNAGMKAEGKKTYSEYLEGKEITINNKEVSQ
jgi:hypothetical protein